MYEFLVMEMDDKILDSILIYVRPIIACPILGIYSIRNIIFPFLDKTVRNNKYDSIEKKYILFARKNFRYFIRRRITNYAKNISNTHTQTHT